MTRERITTAELEELLEREGDILIHQHKGKKTCIAFYGDVQPFDERRMLTLLRLISSDLSAYFKRDDTWSLADDDRPKAGV